MPATKRVKDSPPPLLDITSLVNIQQPLILLADGRKRKRASAFRVNVHSDAFDDGVKECFLKIFPADTANAVAFKAECDANHALNTHVSASEALAAPPGTEVSMQPIDALKSHLQLATRGLPWPLCYGRLSVANPFFAPPRATSKTKAPPEAPKMHALLFQFLDGLALCAPNDLDAAGTMATQIFAALARVHAARVWHRDLEDRALWPDAAFRNVFVHGGAPVILDFDHSRVVPENDRDAGRLAEEEREVRALIAKAVEGQGRERGWGLSREAKRLL